MRTALAVAAVCVLLVIAAGAGVYYGRSAADGAPASPSLSSASSSQAISTSTSQTAAITGYSLCFSPGGNCSSLVAAAFASANSSIHIMIYEFSDTALADALVQAKDRGVSVEVIMDGSEAATDNVGVVDILNQSGIPLKIYTPLNGILHDKIAIIDDDVVVTGSYNWSYSANDFNDENLLVLQSTVLAAQYEADFETLWNLNSTG